MARYYLVGFLILAAGFVGGSRLFSDEVVTNEALTAALGKSKSHTIMQKQNRNILNLMDAFLRGDSDLIAKLTGEIAGDISEVAKKFPPVGDQEAAQWKLMAQIVENAAAMRESALKRDCQAAYQNFTAMMTGCVACHQLRRSWGVFPEPKPPEETPPPAKK